MKTAITVETNDRVRFVIGQLATGEPHLASRDEVEGFYSEAIDNQTRILEQAADRQRDAVKATLNQTPMPRGKPKE